MADQELRGVGGWLGFLVVILGVISPIRILIETGINLNVAAEVAQSLGSNWTIYKITAWLLSLTAAACSIYLAYRLNAVRRRSTVGLVIKGMWILAFVPQLLDLLLSLALFPHLSDALMDPSLIADLTKSLIFPTVWSLYLLKSVRVANTYSVDSSAAEEIFG